jgi:hypothetical protein
MEKKFASCCILLVKRERKGKETCYIAEKNTPGSVSPNEILGQPYSTCCITRRKKKYDSFQCIPDLVIPISPMGRLIPQGLPQRTEETFLKKRRR